MKLAVIDFETTGIGDSARVCELAVVHAWDDWRAAQLFDPGVPMPPEASAVHHLTDEDLRHKPTFDQPTWEAFTDGADAIVAHHAAYDLQFAPWETRPVICTWKTAVRAWPDCPSHSNQCLRYYLKLKPILPSELAPHRALYDALVTTELLRELNKIYGPEQLIAITREPAKLPRVGFGRNRGKRWEAMDDGFLRWVLGQNFDEDVKYTARLTMEDRAASRLRERRWPYHVEFQRMINGAWRADEAARQAYLEERSCP